MARTIRTARDRDLDEILGPDATTSTPAPGAHGQAPHVDDEGEGLFERILADASRADAQGEPQDDDAQLKAFLAGHEDTPEQGDATSLFGALAADVDETASGTDACAATKRVPSPQASPRRDSNWPASNYGPAYWSHHERASRALRRPSTLRRTARSDGEMWEIDEVLDEGTPKPDGLDQRPDPAGQGAAAPGDSVAWPRAPRVHASAEVGAWLDGLAADHVAADDPEARLLDALNGSPRRLTVTAFEAVDTLFARPLGLTGPVRLVDGNRAAHLAAPPETFLRAARRARLRRHLVRLVPLGLVVVGAAVAGLLIMLG